MAASYPLGSPHRCISQGLYIALKAMIFVRQWSQERALQGERLQRVAEILRGKGDEILSLVMAGSDAKQWAQWLRVPLEHALAGANVELAKDLLDAGADASTGQGGINESPLVLAAARGGASGAVEMIVDAGSTPDVNVAQKSYKEPTPMQYAAFHSNLGAIRSLASHGANMNARNTSGLTPLHFAVAMNHDDAVLELVRLGADPTLGSAGKGIFLAPLPFAIHQRSDRAAKALIEMQAQGPPRSRTKHDTVALHAAAEKDTPELVGLMLEHGASIEERDSQRKGSALHTAVHFCSTNTVAYLLEMGADVKARDDAQMTPLHHVAPRIESVRSVDMLIRAGAEIEAKDIAGRTPLLQCLKTKNAATVEALLHHDANEEAVDKEGRAANDYLHMPVQVTSTATEVAQICDRIGVMLARAPADRAWRRRGWLVTLRARVQAFRRIPNVDSREEGGTGSGEEGISRRGKDEEISMGSGERNRASTHGESTSSAEAAADVYRLLEETGGDCSTDGAHEKEDPFREFAVAAAALDEAWEGIFRNIVLFT